MSPGALEGLPLRRLLFTLLPFVVATACAACDASRLDTSVSAANVEPIALLAAKAPPLPTTSTTVAPRPAPRPSRFRVQGQRIVDDAPRAATGGPCDRPSTCPALRKCENGGSYERGSSWPRYFGAYQFARGTWLSNGGTEANWGNADAATQDANADLLFSRRGRQPWPICGRFLR